MIGIYKITSPSDKIYIGQSVNIKNRFLAYKRLDCKSQIALYRSLKKYGCENHIFEIIEQCSIELLNERERYWQDYYNVLNGGLNCILTKTNDKSGKLSKGTKLKIGASNKIANKGKFNKSHIEYLSKINKGKKKPKGFSENLSKKRLGIKNPMFGKKIKESSKQLQREKISGEKNYLSKIILNTETGIYYFGLNEASLSINISKARLWTYLKGNIKNKTNLIYV